MTLRLRDINKSLHRIYDPLSGSLRAVRRTEMLLMSATRRVFVFSISKTFVEQHKMMFPSGRTVENKEKKKMH